MSNDDRMSSVSRSSRISAKSMVIIEAQDKKLAEQGGQISDMAKEMAMMKRLLEEAGIKAVPEVENLIQVEVEAEKKKTSKKRLPSGSPDGKTSGNNEQQYRLFPLPVVGWVGLELGQGEPVLGHKNCWNVSLVVNDYCVG